MPKKMTITFSDNDMDIYEMIKSHKSPSKFIINSLRYGSLYEEEEGKVNICLSEAVKDFIQDTIYSMSSSLPSVPQQQASESYEDDLFNSLSQFD